MPAANVMSATLMLLVMIWLDARLDGNDRVRPHLAPIDRVDHLGPENPRLEFGVLVREIGAEGRGAREQGKRNEARSEILSEDEWKPADEEAKRSGRTLALRGIDGMVGAREQLVQVLRETARAPILAHDRKIGRDLTIQQAELLQLRARERSDPASRSLVEQRLEPRPVRLTVVQPAGGDHGWNRMSG